MGSSNQYFITDLQSESEERPFAAYNTPDRVTDSLNQYSVSKLFVMFVQTALTPLANGRDAEPEVYVTVVCPGATQSDLARDVMFWYYQPFLWLFKVLVQLQTEEGARTYISGVCQGERPHGGFLEG